MPHGDNDRAPWVFRLSAKLSRVWRNPAQLRTELGFTRTYWRLRRLSGQLRFGAFRRLDALSEAGHRQRTALSVHRQVLSAVSIPAVLAISSVVTVLAADAAARTRFSSLLKQLYASYDAVQPEVFAVPLLSNIAQIGGVFLGLYFATISVVASTNYARVPPAVRALLTEEQVGNRYVRMLAFVTAYSTLLILAGSLGFQPGPLALATSGILAVYAVFTFVVLGRRAFHFFDPSALANDVPRETVRWFRRAVRRDGRWKTASFQQYCRQSSERRIVVLQQLVQLALPEGLADSSALGGIVRHALRLQAVYSDHKNRIPTKSYWFARRHRHPDWFLSSSSELVVALNSGHPIMPEEVEDLDWLDRGLDAVIADGLAPLLSSGAWEECLQSLFLSESVLQQSAHNLLVRESLSAWRGRLELALELAIDSVPIDADFNPEHATSVRVLGVLDVAASGLSAILIGVGTRFQKLEPAFVQVSCSDLLDPGTALEMNLPRSVLREAEHLSGAVAFEREVEGEVQTADWYATQLLALAWGRFVSAILKELSSALESSVEELIRPRVADEKTLPAAQLIVRFLEICNKARFHLEVVKRFGDSLSAFRRASDIPWFELDDSHLTRVKQARRSLLQMLASLTDRLYSLPRSDWTPDYFGQAYAFVADRCWESLLEGEDDDFAELFPVLFGASLKAQARVLTYSGQFSAEDLAVLFADPLEDLAELSGYAIALEDLGQGAGGAVVKAEWDSYLDNSGDAGKVVRGVAAALEMIKFSLRTPSRSMVRTMWKQQFAARLRDLGVLRDRGPRYDFGNGTTAPRTRLASALTGRHSAYDGQDIFLAAYLSARPEASGLELPALTSELRRVLTEERAAGDEV